MENPGELHDKDGEHAFVDIKERGGDETSLKNQLSDLSDVEIVEFRPSDEDKLLRFG